MMKTCERVDPFDPAQRPIAEPLAMQGGVPIQGFTLRRKTKCQYVAVCPGLIYSPQVNATIIIQGVELPLVVYDRICYPE